MATSKKTMLAGVDPLVDSRKLMGHHSKEMGQGYCQDFLCSPVH